MFNDTWKKFSIFFAVITDAKTPIQLKLLFIAAILYGVSPMDIITDVIPLFGIIDDIIVIAATLAFLWKKTAKMRSVLRGTGQKQSEATDVPATK